MLASRPAASGLAGLQKPATTDFSLDLPGIFWLSIFTGVVWLSVILVQDFGRWFGMAFVLLVMLISVYYAAKGDMVASISTVIYVAMLQPAIRRFLPGLPYLTLEYFFIVCSSLMLLKHKSKGLSAPAFFYLLYLCLEILGLFVTFNGEYARSIFFGSLSMSLSLLLAPRIGFLKTDLARVFKAVIVGAFNLVVLILYGYLTSTIDWGRQSSFAASGGMGPVQISMLLALAMIIFLIMADQVTLARRVMYGALAMGVGLIMVLTFSRNGLYLTVIALIVYYLLFSRISWRTIFIILMLSGAAIYMYGLAVQIAGNAFQQRYANLDSSNRDALALYGWRIFQDNMLWGVGTGNYYNVVSQAEYFGTVSGAHNELIRAAAEHGILGLMSWSLFLISSIWLGLRAKGKTRALRMAILAVFFAYLAVNGMKMLIQPLLLLVALSVEAFE